MPKQYPLHRDTGNLAVNIFLIDPSPSISAREFLEKDQIRARKQLLECCQILATVDHLLFNKTEMLKKDGTPYGITHKHHPCVTFSLESITQWELCIHVAHALAEVIPSHACAKSYWRWRLTYCLRPQKSADARLIVVRKNHPQIFVNDYVLYAKIMLDYLRSKGSKV